MGTFKTVEEIEAWQKARELVREIYAISSQRLFVKDFGLRDQIRRTGISIMSNIAEGFERSGTKEFVQFLAMAKGSVGEVKSQLYVALDQQYITQQDFNRVYALSTETGRMINGLMNYLRKSKITGSKYKKILT